MEADINDPDRVAELHAMRIAAKRLRYTMELFAPFYSDDFRAAITHVKKIQEQLGNIHDADVLVPQLAAYLRRHLANDVHQNLKATGDRGACERSRRRTGTAGALPVPPGERDSVYQQFLKTWSALREESFFDRLWVTMNCTTESMPPGSNIKKNGTKTLGGQTHDTGQGSAEQNRRATGRPNGRKRARVEVEHGSLEPPDPENLKSVRTGWRGNGINRFRVWDRIWARLKKAGSKRSPSLSRPPSPICARSRASRR